jgi:hypothetical protein
MFYVSLNLFIGPQLYWTYHTGAPLQEIPPNAAATYASALKSTCPTLLLAQHPIEGGDALRLYIYFLFFIQRRFGVCSHIRKKNNKSVEKKVAFLS